jgi:aspartyl/asparaginyl beta-hydroxylase (cupin superfamily)
MTEPDPAFEDAARLNREAVRAMANRRFAEAVRLLDQALALDATLLPAWMNLAAVKRGSGDLAGALAAIDAARKIGPDYFPALLMRGSLLEAAGRPREAALAYQAALAVMHPEDRADPAIERAVANANQFLATYRREMEAYFLHEIGAVPSTSSGAPARRMGGFIEHLMGKRRVYHSAPAGFYYPGLPSIEFHDREDFPWLHDLEAATARIQGELAAVFEDERAAAEIEPYAQFDDQQTAERWKDLNYSLRWSAYHFANAGQRIEAHWAKCPFTSALLDRMPQPDLSRRSPAALFSILRPKTHIPPHCGVANFRLICHLPLILPPDCRLRVGNVTRAWKMGEAFVFDDTIEHEAWNDSDQMRTVFIFDIWHPALTAEERAFISRSVEFVDRFNEMK